MNLLLVFFSVFAVNFAAAEASEKAIQPIKRRPDGEEEVGCFGLCTAFVIGVASAAATAAASNLGSALIGGVAVYGLQKGYEWYTQAPGYEMLSHGKVCKSGMEITTWEECQKALSKSSAPTTKAMVQNLEHEDNKATMPKGCFVESKTSWNDADVVEAAFNKDGSAQQSAMEAIHANALCKTYETAEELEAQVAEYERRVAAESEVASSAISKGENDILNKILFLFIGASLGCAAMYFMRKDGALLKTDYEAL